MDLGDLFGGGSSKVKTEPWSAQEPYLQSGFNWATQLYKQMRDRAQQGYQGSTYAQMNPEQLDAVQKMLQFSGGTGTGLVNQMAGAAQGALNQGGAFGPQAAQIFAKSMQDPTQAIMSSAGQYASNPYMDQMIDAASRDVTRNLTENQIPALTMSRVGTGNLGSSREAIARGILQRGATENIQDIGAALRGNAYNTGLGTAAGLFGTGLSGALGASSQTGNLLNMGMAGAPAALNAAAVNLGAQSAAGGQLQQNEQGALNEAYNKWLSQMQMPWQNLQNYWGIVGNPMGSTTTTPDTGPGIFQQLTGMGMDVAGATALLGQSGLFGGQAQPYAGTQVQSQQSTQINPAQAAMMAAMLFAA
jgi:hypothetical protein